MSYLGTCSAPYQQCNMTSALAVKIMYILKTKLYTKKNGTVVAYTDLSDKELHGEVGVGSMLT